MTRWVVAIVHAPVQIFALVRVCFCCCEKTPPSRAVWRDKGLFQPAALRPSLREVRAGTRGRDLEAGLRQRPLRNSASQLAPQGLLSLVSYTAQDPNPMAWAHPCQSSVQKISWRTCLQTIWRRNIFSFEGWIRFSWFYSKLPSKPSSQSLILPTF